MTELVVPSEKYKESFLAAIREVQASDAGIEDTSRWNIDEVEENFNIVIDELRRYEPGNEIPEEFVHSEYRWLIKDGEYIGHVSIRHKLNERLRQFGGHIGYQIRPSERRQGNGTLMLKLALERARELDIQQVLITCDADNIASYGVIEANGGKLEGEFNLDFYDRPIRRYWIAL
jgi:predicted acetyltransferase